MSFETPADFSKAVRNVRSDISYSDWCLVGYADDSVLRMVGSGNGGLEALLDAAEPFGVNYGLLRVKGLHCRCILIDFSFFLSFFPAFRSFVLHRSRDRKAENTHAQQKIIFCGLPGRN